MATLESLLADFLTQQEAAAELTVCERTLDRWRRLDEGPPITKLGRRILIDDQAYTLGYARLTQPPRCSRLSPAAASGWRSRYQPICSISTSF